MQPARTVRLRTPMIPLTLPTRTSLALAALGAGCAILVVCTAAIACACLLVARLGPLTFAKPGK